MKTLVWVEHDGKAVKDATLAVVTAASKLGEVHLLVAGSGVDAVAKEAAQIAGVGKVHVADNAAFDHNLPENVAPLVAELMGSHDRSEEHTSELQSLMRISYAVFCLKKKNTYTNIKQT